MKKPKPVCHIYCLVDRDNFTWWDHFLARKDADEEKTRQNKYMKSVGYTNRVCVIRYHPDHIVKALRARVKKLESLLANLKTVNK